MSRLWSSFAQAKTHGGCLQDASQMPLGLHQTPMSLSSPLTPDVSQMPRSDIILKKHILQKNIRKMECISYVSYIFLRFLHLPRLFISRFPCTNLVSYFVYWYDYCRTDLYACTMYSMSGASIRVVEASWSACWACPPF